MKTHDEPVTITCACGIEDTLLMTLAEGADGRVEVLNSTKPPGWIEGLHPDGRPRWFCPICSGKTKQANVRSS